MPVSAALTPGQLGLWFVHAVAPRAAVFNTCTAIDLHGPLQPAALRAAVREVGRRHETLRTVFGEESGEPRQWVVDDPAELRLVDMTHVTDPVREAEVERLLAALAATPFDLTAAPPVRWLLLRLAPQRHLLVLDAHHIVCDHHSLGVICGELGEAYARAQAGRPAAAEVPKPELATLARAWNRGDEPAGLRFWAERLAGAPHRTDVFAGQPVTVGPQPPLHVRQRYGPEELARLAPLCGAERATPFMALLALVAGLVARYTGQGDVVLGAPVSLRGDPAYADSVGLLVNLVPLRLRIDGTASLRSALRVARSALLDALEHPAVPLHRVVDVAGTVRAPGTTTPLVQVVVTYQREVAPVLVGARAVSRPVTPGAAKYQLSITATETASGLDLLLESDRRWCTVEDLATFGRYLTALLHAGSADPDAVLNAVDVRDDGERQRARRRASGASVPRPVPQALHALVLDTAVDRPDAVAVSARDGQGDPVHLSYGALRRAALRLAADLSDRLAGPEPVVAVLQRRGVGLPVSYLAVLVAGGVVLPLEPDDPDARLAELVADSGATLVLTDSRQLDRARRLAPVALAVEEVLVADRWPRDVVLGPRPGHPEQAAYLLYTSGSTGRPKGVLVPHRGITNRVLWGREQLPDGYGERTLVKTPIAFDVSMAELFAPLAAGGCAVLAAVGGERDPQYLAEVVTHEQVTGVHFVPSMLAPFLAEVVARGRGAGTLRVLTCSGEALLDGLACRTLDLFDVDLYNLYGPTEASVEVTAWHADRRSAAAVSIGRPIANVECHLLDDRLRPVPDPVAGELHLGGHCLARGYAGRPAMTATAFLPWHDGARVYRTGDHGRWTARDEIRLLGRRDDQVKLLGRRVEPGEVRQALCAHGDVVDAAVLVLGGRLVGFVAYRPDASGPPSGEALREALRSRLPGYLVPAAVQVLPQLPVTRSGKVDRNALTRLAEGTLLKTRTGRPPRTDLERTLAALWCEVLDVSDIGVDDGFFEAGGNSLALLRLHHRLVTEVADDLTVKDLFHHASVAALARHLADRPFSAATTRARTLDAAARAQRRRSAQQVAARPQARDRGVAR
ncbi:non-ribosomal peptide synthetase [Micromonospora okii]|uniref:non-ribosomal peptide synthetase n=1 Tax=Micromonospora okii TaxID=1182970 RepID=UPI001E4C01AC|nr:non-ribosomal peptide synthetase [Micromonospora okii]